MAAALQIYNTANEGSNPRQHFRSIIDIRYEAAGLFVHDLYATVTLFSIQSMKNEFLTGTEVDRHLDMIQVIVRASRNAPEMLIEFLLET